MFDIGFSELVLVFVVGLVVLGPKRLPIAIKTVMSWVATIRGLAANVQNELAQELKLQELQESIKKAESLNLSQFSPELTKTLEDLKQSAAKMKQDLESTKGNIESLTQEQVANIQQTIEAESLQLQQESLKQAEDKTPISVESETLEKPNSADELAEMAEFDETILYAYYPSDDTLAETAPIENSNVQEKKDVS